MRDIKTVTLALFVVAMTGCTHYRPVGLDAIRKSPGQLVGKSIRGVSSSGGNKELRVKWVNYPIVGGKSGDCAPRLDLRLVKRVEVKKVNIPATIGLSALIVTIVGAVIWASRFDVAM